MVQINLLPEQFDRRKKIASNLNALILILVSLSVFFIILLSILSFSVRVKENTLAKLREDFKKADLVRKQINTLQSDKKDLQDRLILLEDVLHPKFLISDKLIELKRYLPDDIWFIGLYLDISRADKEIEKKSKGLKIEGMALISKEEGMLTSLTEFVDNLKQDASFFNDFSSIELENLKKEMVGNVDATTFRLLFTLK